VSAGTFKAGALVDGVLRIDDGASDDALPGYEPPRLVPLGALADLTQGGTSGSDDGFGGAGDSGSL
jgi:hypothetical protein